ncbi:peptide-methionine (S)-S-oxide reductase [Seinonella peptonophila]|uniref:Peptide methionine sulfoxide reductase MsrA n=1 Tax=Seinonella peptonophila TaxID=112248 RepID=A0A1M5BDR4_9BACL|nr:peptide-methionine (S)-S-oxide reductase [Seinonella peptonophila]
MNHSFELATFAGGCFWCMMAPFENLTGVKKVVAGYTGGHTKNPTYEEVCTGKTGHIEAIQITYDPKKLTYSELLEVFWMQIDPTDPGGQFADRGIQYQTAIFYHSESQHRQAVASKQQLANSGRFSKPIMTQLKKATVFYPAEPMHQDYHKKNQQHYQSYRYHSGRDQFLERVWKKK